MDEKSERVKNPELFRDASCEFFKLRGLPTNEGKQKLSSIRALSASLDNDPAVIIAAMAFDVVYTLHCNNVGLDQAGKIYTQLQVLGYTITDLNFELALTLAREALRANFEEKYASKTAEESPYLDENTQLEAVLAESLKTAQATQERQQGQTNAPILDEDAQLAAVLAESLKTVAEEQVRQQNQKQTAVATKHVEEKKSKEENIPLSNLDVIRTAPYVLAIYQAVQHLIEFAHAASADDKKIVIERWNKSLAVDISYRVADKALRVVQDVSRNLPIFLKQSPLTWEENVETKLAIDAARAYLRQTKHDRELKIIEDTLATWKTGVNLHREGIHKTDHPTNLSITKKLAVTIQTPLPRPESMKVKGSTDNNKKNNNNEDKMQLECHRLACALVKIERGESGERILNVHIPALAMSRIEEIKSSNPKLIIDRYIDLMLHKNNKFKGAPEEIYSDLEFGGIELWSSDILQRQLVAAIAERLNSNSRLCT